MKGVAARGGVRLLRRPDLRREEFRLLVLHDMASVGGDSLAVPPFPAHLEAVVVAVAHGVRRQRDFPDVGIRYAEALERGVDFPLGEIADKPHASRVGGPFVEYPAVLGTVQAVVLVCACPI